MAAAGLWLATAAAEATADTPVLHPLEPTPDVGAAPDEDDPALDCPNAVSAMPLARAEWLQCAVGEGAPLSISGCPGVGIAPNGTLTGAWATDDCTAEVLGEVDGELLQSIIDVQLRPLETFGGAQVSYDLAMGRTMLFTGGSQFAHAGGSSVEVPGGFTNTGLTWDPVAQQFIVSDFDTGSLWLLSPDGAAQGTIVTPVGPYTLQGVAIGPSGELLVSDHYGHTVVRILRSGQLILPQPFQSLGYRPNGVDYDPWRDGLWVAESGSNRLHRYNIHTGEHEQILALPGIHLVDGLDYDELTDELWVTFDGGTPAFSATTGIARVGASTGVVLDILPDPARAPEGIVVRYDANGDSSLWLNDDGLFHNDTERGNRLHHWSTAGEPAPFGAFPQLPFTVELAFNASPSQVGLGTLAWWGASTSATQAYALYLRADQGHAVEAWHRDGSKYSGIATSSTGAVAGQWNHVVAVFTATERHIYLNGGGHGQDLGPRGEVPIDRGAIGLSRDATPGQPLSGRVAGVVIRQGALSQAEATALYDAWQAP